MEAQNNQYSEPIIPRIDLQDHFSSTQKSPLVLLSITTSTDQTKQKPLLHCTALHPMGSNSNSSPSNTIPVVSIFANPLGRWPGMYQSPVINAVLEAKPSMFEQILGPLTDAPPQTELHTKTPSQSRISLGYSFSSDDIIREQYRDAWNEIRMGKVLEDLDAIAGTIAYEHCSDVNNATRPLLLVTASVYNIILQKPIRIDTDLKIVGAVAWVGRSSITIRLEATQNLADGDTALAANFTFAARDSKTGKSAPVNRLSPETEQEKKLYEEMEAIDRLRKEKRGRIGRELEETDRLNALLAQGNSDSSIVITDTRLENSWICQPQHKNIHGRIYGGFLMNTAFELAFSTAYTFAGLVPCFLQVDHIEFLRPVDVGDFLRLKSCVLYTELGNMEQALINVEVVAHVTRPELRTSVVSNTFYFTFTVESQAMRTNGLKMPSVVPATEEEARRVLERMDAQKL